MDKPLKLEQARVIAKDYSTRIIPLETNILDALGVTRALQDTVESGKDAIANIETLEKTLADIESTLNGAGIEASNVKVPDLSGFIGQLASQIVTLQTQINEAETRLEELV